MRERIAFMGGGNMASAIIGGLLKQGFLADQFDVVEPYKAAQAKLNEQYGIVSHTHPEAFLSQADMIVWAVKPQVFKEAALGVRPYTENCLHLSIAAGVRSDNIYNWLNSERIVRCMPNTPALIGKGIAALFARDQVSGMDKQSVERVIASTGEFLWVPSEDHLDAVTAISGSGPAYVFYFMEAMISAGESMGLSHEQAHKLTVATFVGASALAYSTDELPEVLRQRVTSKGGTTYAATTSMDTNHMKMLFTQALNAAKVRAHQLGDEFT